VKIRTQLVDVAQRGYFEDHLVALLLGHLIGRFGWATVS